MDLEGIFNPLTNEYCLWFYYLQIIGFIFLVIILLSSLFVILGLGKSKSKNKTKVLGGLLVMITTYGIFYFQNRLFYSICTKALD